MNDLTTSGNNEIYNQECVIHPKNDIIYYCKSVYCEKTLCFNCLKDHSNIHKSNKTSQNLITITQLKKENQEKINEQLTSLLSEIKTIENHYLYNYESILKNYVNSLTQARANTELIVKNFFDNIEFKIKNTLLEIYEKNYPFIIKSLEGFKRLISKLNDHKCQLDKEINLNCLLALNFEELIKDYEIIKNETYSQLETLSRKNLCIKDEVFSKLTNMLSEEIRYESKTDLEFIQEQNIYYSKLKQKHLNHNNMIEELKISAPNYFSDENRHKILHFFQDNTKLLRIIDVESLYNSVSKSYHIFDIPLNISFDIPAWHKSLITPTGDIYLIGGINSNEGNKELKLIFKFDYDELTLLEYPPILKERYGHELCYYNENIYIMGGSNDNDGMMTFCEKYDLIEKKNKAMSPLKIKTFGGCSCLVNQEYIYLFGGLIEDKILNNSIQRYDINKDNWEIIEYKTNNNDDMQIPWCSAAIQINFNQILVFGGYFAENEGSRTSFILELEKIEEKTIIAQKNKENLENKEIIENSKNEENEKNHTLLRNNKFDLPYGEGFWNNQVILQKEKIFCLQNIQNEEDTFATQLDLRRVLSFTGKKWAIYEKKT